VTFPSLAYGSFVYPLILAMILKVSGSLFMAAFLNVILAGVNAVMLYLILDNIYHNARLSFYGAILSSVSFSAFITSIHIWSEQVHLLILLFAILYFLRHWEHIRPVNLLFLGIVLALGYLTRVAGLFNLLAFALFIFLKNGFKKQAWVLTGYLLLGFLAVVIPYQLFCFFNYRMFYPQYIKMDWDRARVFGGYFDAQGIPVLRSVSFSGFSRVLSFFYPLWAKLVLSIKEIYINLGFLSFFLFASRQKENPGINWKQDLLWVIAIINFAGVIIYPMFRFSELDISRYSLISCFLLMPIALASLLRIFALLGTKFNARFCNAVAIGLVNICLLTLGSYYSSFSGKPLNRIIRARQNLEREVFAWIKGNSFSAQRIGLCPSLIQEGFQLNRPVVCVPDRALLTSQNLQSFLKIYNPAFMIIAKNKMPNYAEIIRPFAMRVETDVSWDKRYIVYKPNINMEGR